MRKKLVKIDENVKNFQDVAPAIRDVANSLENEKYSEEVRLEAIRTLMPLIGRMRAGISINEEAEDEKPEYVEADSTEIDEAFNLNVKGDYLVAIGGVKERNIVDILKQATNKEFEEIPKNDWVNIKVDKKHPFFNSYLGKASVNIAESKKGGYDILVKKIDEEIVEDEKEYKSINIKANNKLGLLKVIEACERAGVKLKNRKIDENCVEIDEEDVEKVKDNLEDIELINEEELLTVEVPNDAGVDFRLDKEIFEDYVKDTFIISEKLNRYIENQNVKAVEVGIDTYKEVAGKEVEALYKSVVDAVTDKTEDDKEYKISLIKNYIIVKAGYEAILKINGGM